MKTIIFLTMVTAASLGSAYSQTLNKSTLCKKWYLKNYEVFWIDYEPEEKEKNDYILLNTDMTYESVDEGKKSEGKWSYNASEEYVQMYNKKGEGLKLLIIKLKKDELVFKLDIDEMEDVEIHYSTKKTNK